MELRPFDDRYTTFLQSLQEQEDVWEFIGTSPLAAYEPGNHVFVITEGDVALGIAGLFKSRGAEPDDFELVCATGAEAQHRGLATQACETLLAWGLDTAKLDRVIACIDESNHPARAIATKIGMTELGRASSGRILYAKSRDSDVARRRY